MALGISKEQFQDLAKLVMDAMTPIIRDESHREIEGQLHAYRKAVSVRDHWCCRDMQTFAADVWSANAPCVDPQGFGGVSYQLRGHHINFCPFCGVHLSVGADAVRRTA